MPVTSADVARLAGVSRATVSYIVNSKGDRFSEETRRAVLEAAAELGYQPQAAGRALVTGRSNIVLVAVPHTPNSVFLPMIERLASRLAEHALTLLLLPPIDSVSAFASTIRSVRPHSVMSIGSLPAGYEEELRLTETRWLDFAGAMSGPDGFNWRIGALQAGHLIERGYSALCYARSREALGDVVQWAREQGFRQACAARALPDPVVIEIDASPAGGRPALSSLPAGAGLACFNDETALTVLYAAAQEGTAVPDDLGVIGVDDTPAARTVIPALSSIGYDIDPERTILAAVMAGRADQEGIGLSLALESHLGVEARDSTAR